MEQENSNQQSEHKVTQKEFDYAFDLLAQFLFDQYRKHKEVAEASSNNQRNQNIVCP